MTASGIVWLDGDGPGRELIVAARAVFGALGLDQAYESRTARIGWDEWVQRGDTLPQETAELCAQSRCTFIGALASGPEAPDLKGLLARAAAHPERAADPLGRLRQRLGLPIQLGEFKRPGIEPEGFELTLLAAEPADPEARRRAMQLAFEAAQRASSPVLTVLDEPPAPFGKSGPLASQAREAGAGFPGVRLRESGVLAFCTGLLETTSAKGAAVCTPAVFPAVAALASHLGGGAFCAGTAYLGAERGCFTTLPPAQRGIVGPERASPVGALQALRMMLSFLDQAAAATRLDGALAALGAHGPRTVEQGGDASGQEVTRFVLDRLGPG
jgi:isocitrate/isopropylmalate dehydrogenase